MTDNTTPIQELIKWLEEWDHKEAAYHARKVFIPKEKEFVRENFNAGYQLSEHKSGKGIERPTLTEYLNQLYPKQ